MKKADVLIANNGGIYKIKVNGRATFECCPPLRNLAKNIEAESFEKVSINLEQCTGMDSTFMGILAMIGLRARKINAEMEIINAGETNINLFNGLGLKKIFKYVDRDEEKEGSTAWTEPKAESSNLSTAETVLDAHETLMDVDKGNVSKFEKVVDMVKKDIDNLSK